MNNSYEQPTHSKQSGEYYYTPPAPPAEFYEKAAIKRSGKKVGLSLIFFFASTLFVSVALGIVLGALGKQALASDKFFVLFVNLLATTVGFLGGGLFLKKQLKEKNLISFAAPKNGSFFPLVIMGLGFCYVANMAVSLLANNLSFLGELKGGEIDMPSGPLGFAFTVLSVAVFPAFLEEFFFRGVLLGTLSKFGKPFAIFTSSLLFGLIHGNLVQIPFAFLVGIILSFAVLESGSIWTGIVIHFLNNFISICFKYLSDMGGEEASNLIFSLFILVAMGLGFLGLYLLCVRDNKVFEFPKTNHTTAVSKRFWWFVGSPTIIISLVFVALEILATQLAA